MIFQSLIRNFSARETRSEIELFIHAALISAVFIRPLPALLVAPRNFAPQIIRVTALLPCSAARQREKQA
jgi:hypothetical protein